MQARAHAAPRIVEWFRADPWPRIRIVLLTGPPILTLGGVVIAVSLLAHASRPGRTGAAALGFVLVAGGALSTMLRMQRILRDEVFLSLRTDGLHVQDGRVETFLPWDELAGARWDPGRGALVVSRSAGEDCVFGQRFAGIRGEDLAARIVMTKRRAAMKLLR